MTTTVPFVPLQEFKDFMEVRPEVTSKDTRYKMLLATAQEQIEEATGRLFAHQQITEFFASRDNRSTDYDFGGVNGFGDTSSFASSGMLTRTKPQTFYLRGIGIDRDADFRVWYDPYAIDDTAYGEDALLTPNQDYQIDFAEDALVLRIGTSYRPRAVKVSYSAGFAPDEPEDPAEQPTLTDSIPETLKLALFIQAQFLNVKLRADNIGMDSERTTSAKDRVTSSPFMARAGLTPEVVNMVARYRRLRLGVN